jgi:serine/threonine-protein kinase RIO1
MKKEDDRVPGRDFYTEREWRNLPRVGSSGCSMVKPVTCIHGVLFKDVCDECAAYKDEVKP